MEKEFKAVMEQLNKLFSVGGRFHPTLEPHFENGKIVEWVFVKNGEEVKSETTGERISLKTLRDVYEFISDGGGMFQLPL